MFVDHAAFLPRRFSVLVIAHRREDSAIDRNVLDIDDEALRACHCAAASGRRVITPRSSATVAPKSVKENKQNRHCTCFTQLPWHPSDREPWLVALSSVSVSFSPYRAPPVQPPSEVASETTTTAATRKRSIECATSKPMLPPGTGATEPATPFIADSPTSRSAIALPPSAGSAKPSAPSTRALRCYPTKTPAAWRRRGLICRSRTRTTPSTLFGVAVVVRAAPPLMRTPTWAKNPGSVCFSPHFRSGTTLRALLDDQILGRSETKRLARRGASNQAAR